MSDVALTNTYNTANERAEQISAAQRTASVVDQLEQQVQGSKVGQVINTGRKIADTAKTIRTVAAVVGNPLFWPIIFGIITVTLLLAFIAIGFSKLQDNTGVNITDLCARLGDTCMDQIIQQSGQAVRNASQ